MRKIVVTVAILLALGAAGTAGAQWATSFHLIPVVAKTAGAAGTDWRSDLSISNLSTFAVAVRAGFFREATNNQLSFDLPVRVTLQPGETRDVGDVVGAWFPEQGNTKGALLLLGEPAGAGDPDAVLLAASTRTYNNANPSATYGQGVDSGLMSLVYGPGIAAMTGVRHDGRFRSNVGVLNLSPSPLQLLVTTYGATGAQVAQVTKTVESFSLRQWSLDSLGAATLAGGRTEVRVDPSTVTWDPCNQSSMTGFGPGFFIAYLSKVDQGSGDAEFHYAQSDWTEYAADCGEEPSDCP
jgi:hypothetical protein